MNFLVQESKSRVLLTSLDDKYILSEWDCRHGHAMGYVRVATDILERRQVAIKNVLVIGLGGGSIIGELSNRIHNVDNILSIEIDQNIIDVGFAKFSTKFKLRSDLNHTIKCCDINFFTPQKNFDAIFVDIPDIYHAANQEDEKITRIMHIIFECSLPNCTWVLNALTTDDALKLRNNIVTQFATRMSRPRIHSANMNKLVVSHRVVNYGQSSSCVADTRLGNG